MCGLLAPLKPRYSTQRSVQTIRTDDGSPHVEFVDGKYNYVVTERGSEFQRKIARDEDELLYWLMADVVTGVSLQFELENRIPGQDSRRQWFAKSIELLGRLDPKWAERKESEYQVVLELHPFRDDE
jgi:hypothetical protein